MSGEYDIHNSSLHNALLQVHSIIRWIILILILVVIIRSWIRKRNHQPFIKTDKLYALLAVIFLDLQVLLGIYLYFTWRLTDHPLKQIKHMSSNHEARFWVLEHPICMGLAFLLLHFAAIRSRRTAIDEKKFRILFMWFLIALILILIGIPWPFYANGLARPLF